MKVIRYIHQWTSESNNLVIYTFPMIHIGKKEYYKEVSAEIENLNLLLLEGVSVSKRFSEVGSYINFARNMNLCSQKESLQIPKDLSIINIDMKQSVFYKKLTLFNKAQLFFISTYLKLPIFIYGDKGLEKLKLLFSYPKSIEYKMKNPLKHYAFIHKEKSSLSLLIENERNNEIVKNLEQIIKNNRNRKFRFDIGILFGDAHMPHIYQTLNKNNFKWKLHKELIVF